MKSHDIVVVGNLAQMGVLTAVALRRAGYRPLLWLHSSEAAKGIHDQYLAEIGGHNVLIYGRVIFPNWSYGWIKVGGILNRISKFVAELQAAWLILHALAHGVRCIHAHTVSLAPYKVWRKLFIDWGLLPYTAGATGSDLRELPFLGTPAATRAQRFFHQARHVFLLNIDMPQVCQRLGLANWSFLPFAIDTDFFSPSSQGCDELNFPDNPAERHLSFLVVSRVDWGISDRTDHKCGKGTDRFLSAFARYVNEQRLPATATFIESGGDVEAAEALISELGIKSLVRWVPRMEREELRRAILRHQVVVDQFDIGAFGASALEAMACGKPVMMYLDQHGIETCYPEAPPVLNCRDEENILEQIKACEHPGRLRECGEAARNWVRLHHSMAAVGETLASRAGLIQNVRDSLQPLNAFEESSK